MKLLDSIIRESRANPIKASSLDAFSIPAHSVTVVENKVTSEQHSKKIHKAESKAKVSPAEEQNIQKSFLTPSANKSQAEKSSNININTNNASLIKQQLPHVKKQSLTDKTSHALSKEADPTTQENNLFKSREEGGRTGKETGKNYIKDAHNPKSASENNKTEFDLQDTVLDSANNKSLQVETKQGNQEKEKYYASTKRVKKTDDTSIFPEKKIIPGINELPQITADTTTPVEAPEIRIGQINVTVLASESVQTNSQDLASRPEPFGLRRI